MRSFIDLFLPRLGQGGVGLPAVAAKPAPPWRSGAQGRGAPAAPPTGRGPLTMRGGGRSPFAQGTAGPPASAPGFTAPRPSGVFILILIIPNILF